MTCYIIDDDEHAINAIINYVDRVPYLNVIGSHINPLIAIDEISMGEKPDLVFLDVEMPELSGIDVIDLMDKSIAVIFTTAHSKYALQAFQKDAVDFLLKPFSFEMFLKAVVKVKAWMILSKGSFTSRSPEKIFINSGTKGKIVQISTSDIIYIETDKNIVNIHTVNHIYQSRLSLKSIQTKLFPDYFIRIHRSYTVNLNSIRSIEANAVTVSNGHILPIGDIYKNDIMKRIETNTIRGVSND